MRACVRVGGGGGGEGREKGGGLRLRGSGITL